MAGVISTGFVKKSSGEILGAIQARARLKISNVLNVAEDSPIGNLLAIFADEIGLVWDAAESVYSGFDRSFAVDDLLEALGELLGLERGGAAKGLVTATVNLQAAQTFLPGTMIAHVAGIPTNRWVNRDTVTSVGAGNYSAVFESETTGASFVAPSGTLTTIAQPVSGWNSITNALDATSGTDAELLEVYRARIEAAVQAQGSATQGAILAEVLGVAGVIAARVFVNRTNGTVEGLPPHSVRVVLWDGDTPAASNTELAQAIADTVAEGIETVGDNVVLVSDGNEEYSIRFDRATERNIYVATSVIADPDVLAADVKAAVVAAGALLSIGDDVIFRTIEASPFDVDGVDDLTNFFLGTAPAPTGVVNIVIAKDEIAVFDTSRVTVTGDAV